MIAPRVASCRGLGNPPRPTPHPLSACLLSSTFVLSISLFVCLFVCLSFLCFSFFRLPFVFYDHGPYFCLFFFFLFYPFRFFILFHPCVFRSLLRHHIVLQARNITVLFGLLSFASLPPTSLATPPPPFVFLSFSIPVSSVHSFQQRVILPSSSYVFSVNWVLTSLLTFSHTTLFSFIHCCYTHSFFSLHLILYSSFSAFLASPPLIAMSLILRFCLLHCIHMAFLLFSFLLHLFILLTSSHTSGSLLCLSCLPSAVN